MKILNQLFRKTKGKDKGLAGASTVIVSLENQLTEKEAEVAGLRETLEHLYQDAVLGKKDSKKTSKIKVALEEKQSEVEGLKSVIEAAKSEAIILAQTEIEDRLAIKTKLQKQMKEETTAENKKIIAALRELLAAIFKIHGVKGFISKDASLRLNIPTDKMSDKDITKANKKLEAFYEKTITGPYFTAEQISKMVEETAKADPKKSVECALQDARPASPQNESKKAA